MIIQSETQKSVIKKLENIATRLDDEAGRFLTDALKRANHEGRVDMLNSEKNEYEVLYQRSEAVSEALNEIKNLVQDA